MNGFLKKAGLGLAMGATALAAAAPADAQRWRRYDRGRGDVATGAIIGGVVGLGLGAAIASGNRGRYYRDRDYDRGGYWGPRRGYAPRGYYRGYDRGYYPPPPRGYYRGYGRGYYDRGYYGGGGYYDGGYYGW